MKYLYLFICVALMASCGKGGISSNTAKAKEDRPLGQVWQAYQSEFKKAQPKADFMLKAPATKEEITSFETACGHKLPSDIHDLYLIANGQNQSHDEKLEAPIFAPGFRLLPLDEALKGWQQLKGRAGKMPGNKLAKMMGVKYQQNGVKDDMEWNINWLPIGTDGFGNLLCVDYDPAKGGKKGQLITVYFDDVGRNVMADTAIDYLAELEKGLANGQLKFDKYGAGPYSLKELAEFAEIERENNEMDL